ncbi:tetratricopeptide repeat protein [Amycolatopsis sp. WAC 04197]|uniref:tetratricopeptide repeat protein n=1 Tax=Amycolatopsis sp. WAC 04197 TaxID=2203199 RepID=UPI001F2D856B|nr:tetratricopeptide repeat protein [Amycolatopsis sp. WAC 04197]
MRSSDVLVGMPPPRNPPDRPLPPELGPASSHGYNCRCVARYFGLDPAPYGELPACSLSERQYRKLLVEAAKVQDEAKRLAVTRNVADAQRKYARMREIAQRLDRTDLELAAVSDLATLCYSAGDLRNARQCAEAVLNVFKVSAVAIVHFGQYAEARMIEGSREVAERVLISLATEEGDVAKARELIAGQRRRAAFRKEAGPDQYPPELLDVHGVDELELRIFDVRVQIAAGDFAGARTAIEEILAALDALAENDEVRERVVHQQAMVRAERARIRQAGGEDADARADLLRLTAQHAGSPMAAKMGIGLAEARALAGDFPGAVAAIVTARDELAAAGLTGDVAEASHALGMLLLHAGDVSQARAQFEHAGAIRTANGDGPGLRLVDTALARCAAAEGDWTTAEDHANRARESARTAGDWADLLHTDFVAASIGFARGEDLPAVLDLLLPLTLAAAEYRFEFVSPEARTAWARDIAAPTMGMALALLAQLEEPRLAAELVERTCAVGAYTGTEEPTLGLTGALPTLEVGPVTEGLPLAALGSVTSSLPLRLAPPPALRWSPSSPMELDRWLAVAAERYRLPRPVTDTVETWPSAKPGRETFLLRFADAGHTFLTWRTTEDLDTVHTHPIDFALVGTARQVLDAASPTPHEGESVADAVRRSLGEDAFGSFAGEQRLARVLALNLLPADLVERLRRAAAGGNRPLLRIQPSPSLAAVPWGLLALPDRRADRVLEIDELGLCFDGDERVLDVADVSLLAPSAIPRRPSSADGPPVYLLDPRIPGQSAFGELGSVLGKQDATSPLIRHLDERLAEGPVLPAAGRGLDLVRRTDTDRRLLAELVAGPCSRLVFVGHVSRVRDEHGAQTALHLSCAADLPGTAAPIGAHRPFTAADLALSEMDMPARVALVGCASASDFGLAEPFGVLLAAVAAGAGLVAATVWALPTSAAVPGADPMSELVIAVDTALAGEDPVTELCAWQRSRLARWRENPEPATSPVFWAPLTCLDATDDGKTWVR